MENIDKEILGTIPRTGLNTLQISKDSGFAYSTVQNRLLRMAADGIVELTEVRTRGGAKTNVWILKTRVKHGKNKKTK